MGMPEAMEGYGTAGRGGSGHRALPPKARGKDNASTSACGSQNLVQGSFVPAAGRSRPTVTIVGRMRS
jgi:hypothetical protein